MTNWPKWPELACEFRRPGVFWGSDFSQRSGQGWMAATICNMLNRSGLREGRRTAEELLEGRPVASPREGVDWSVMERRTG